MTLKISPVSTIYKITMLVQQLKVTQNAELTYDLLRHIEYIISLGHRVTIQLVSGEIHSFSKDNRVKYTSADILRMIQNIHDVASFTPHIFTHTKATIFQPQSKHYH